MASRTTALVADSFIFQALLALSPLTLSSPLFSLAAVSRCFVDSGPGCLPLRCLCLVSLSLAVMPVKREVLIRLPHFRSLAAAFPLYLERPVPRMTFEAHATVRSSVLARPKQTRRGQMIVWQSASDMTGESEAQLIGRSVSLHVPCGCESTSAKSLPK